MISNENLTALWSDLLKDEPASTKAILKLSKHPTSVTEFLATKLFPLNLAKQELIDTVSRLGSNNEQEWRAAEQKLNYFDPRLAMPLEEVLSLDTVQEYPARHRIVDVLSGRPIDAFYSATSQRFGFISLNKHDSNHGEIANFRGCKTEDDCGSSWWAEPKLENLNVGFSTPKVQWTRIVRSLALLESFESPEAHAIIKSVASGHPDVQPTKLARSMISLGNKKIEDSRANPHGFYFVSNEEKIKSSV